MHVHYTYRSAICLMPFCSTPALEKHPCSLHVPTSGGGHGSSVLLPLATMLPARPQCKYRPRLLANTVQLQTPTFLHPSIFIPKIRRSTTLLVLLTSEEKLATAQSLCRSPMKAVCCSAAMSAVILLLHLLLLGSATAAAAASPTTTTLPPDGQGWAAARRLLLLQPTAIMATATNTFHVKGAAHQPATTTTTTAAARGTKPTVEFNASTKSAPGSGFNPRQN